MNSAHTNNFIYKLSFLLILLVGSSASISFAQNEYLDKIDTELDNINFYSDLLFSNDIDISLDPEMLINGWNNNEITKDREQIIDTIGFSLFTDSKTDTSNLKKALEYLNNISDLIDSQTTIEELESLLIL